MDNKHIVEFKKHTQCNFLTVSIRLFLPLSTNDFERLSLTLLQALFNDDDDDNDVRDDEDRDNDDNKDVMMIVVMIIS